MEKITFTPDTEGETIQLFVLEKTTLGGVDYLLVADQEDGDAEALILKDVTKEEGNDSTYEIVSDDRELRAVAAVFENLLEDIAFVEED